MTLLHLDVPGWLYIYMGVEPGPHIYVSNQRVYAMNATSMALGNQRFNQYDQVHR